MQGISERIRCRQEIQKEERMKAKMIFTFMVGMVDGTWGVGTADSVMKQVLDDKSSEEIMENIGPPLWMKGQKKNEKARGGAHAQTS